MFLFFKLKRFILVVFLFCVACSNIYQGMSNTSTDEAMLENAKMAMDEQNWDTALTEFGSMSSGFKARNDVREAWATVLAGKCGLNFYTFLATVSSANLSSSTFFKFLMNVYTGKVVSPTHCAQAQAKLEEISTDPNSRTESQNLFMAMLGLVKMGTYLRTYADRNGTGNLGDGTAEVNVCTNDASNLPDSVLDQIITGLGLVTKNSSALTAVVGSGAISSTIGNLTTFCSATPGLCDTTDATAITGSQRASFRDLLNTSSTNATAPFGVGSCSNILVTPCC